MVGLGLELVEACGGLSNFVLVWSGWSCLFMGGRHRSEKVQYYSGLVMVVAKSSELVGSG